MRFAFVNRRCSGLTLVEVLVIVATLVIAAAVLVPAFAPNHPTRRAKCLSNLKEIGTAFANWSHDHETGFPWTVSERQGGTMEFTAVLARHFQILSNDLPSTKVLICPQDRGRTGVTDFDHLSNANLSYGLGLDAERPNAILAADRSLTTNYVMLSGVVNFQYPKSLRWAKGMHLNAGNISWADGSAEEVDQLALRKLLEDRGSLPARINLP